MSRLKRHAALTTHARRLTPVEVAQHWFRRSTDFAKQIHEAFPTFPQAGPDGLFLLSHVEAWFDRFHGNKQRDPGPVREEQELRRVINGIR
jgi:hypothetical protein